MKNILLVMIIVLFTDASVFCGEFEDTLKKAEQGQALAQFNLGWMYDNGEGVPQDYKQAIYWYQKSAEQGNIDAQFNLGWMYDNGEGVSQDYRQAVYWYKKAAEQGDADAQNNLGVKYAEGQGVTQDHKQAVYWYKKAAEQGYVYAQYNLGWRYAEGQGVAQDYKQAVYWYKKAAEQGYASAQYKLGWMYYDGQGLTQDHKQAAYWWKKAAEQGYADAQYNLGFMYHNGRGVTQNFTLAYVWESLAAAQGHESAIKNRDIDAKKLSSQQLAEAQDLAAKIQYQIDNPTKTETQPLAMTAWKTGSDEVIGDISSFFNIFFCLACFFVISVLIRFVFLQRPIKNTWVAIGILLPLFILFSVILNIERAFLNTNLDQQMSVVSSQRTHMPASLALLFSAMVFSYLILVKGGKENDTDTGDIDQERLELDEKQSYKAKWKMFDTTIIYAGFWKRVVAYIIDVLIMLVPMFMVGFIVGYLVISSAKTELEMEAFSAGAEGLTNIINIVIAWVYFATMESSSKQGSLGKMALGIKVTDYNGEKISFGKASGRLFGKILSGIIIGIGFLMVGFTRKKQGLHDIMAGTLVVDAKNEME